MPGSEPTALYALYVEDGNAQFIWGVPMNQGWRLDRNSHLLDFKFLSFSTVMNINGP